MTLDPAVIDSTREYQALAYQAALATGIGLLVGLEREWAQKEVGVRTFALTGLLGLITFLIAPSFTLAGLAGVLLLMTFLNLQSLAKDQSLELTTALTLLVVYFLGAMVGKGQEDTKWYFISATGGIVVMLLLAWKLELRKFAGALRPEEIRSAVLLGLLSVVISPMLVNTTIDRWQLFNPHQFWMTVVIIAGIGFLNYVLLRLYSDRGLYYAAVLGGLVNSTAAVAELAGQLRQRATPVARAVSILLLTRMSMFVRNGVILAIFAPNSVSRAAAPLGAMAVATAIIARFNSGADTTPAEPLKLTSPVSLARVTKFGLMFFALAVTCTLAQRWLGAPGFLAASLIGGLVSSASTTATAAQLVSSQQISPATAAFATILTSLASVVVQLPLVQQQTKNPEITKRLTVATVLIIGIGLAAMGASEFFQH
ncbi:MAG: magnesium transporter accessory protein [Phycisphaerales bacterium]|nr:magnesium transporter accessory protein [Phycisphaerales bacterium]